MSGPKSTGIGIDLQNKYCQEEGATLQNKCLPESMSGSRACVNVSTKCPADQNEAVVLHMCCYLLPYIILAQSASVDASMYARFVRPANAIDQASCISD